MNAMDRRWGAAMVAAFSLFYLGQFWNRFLGATLDGWFFFYAQQFLRGEVPYRDFYLFAPPLFVLKTAAYLKIFPATFAMLHATGVAERTVLAVALYLWLARVVSPRIALVAMLPGIVVFSGDTADPVSYYHQDSVLWAVLAGWCAQMHLDRDRNWTCPGFLSGFFTGVCLMTKQTTGLGVTAVIPFTLLLIHGRSLGWREGVRRLAPYAAGWAAPVFGALVWLAGAGALPQFFQQAFLAGTSSKGSLGAVALRMVPASRPGLLGFFVVLILGVILYRFGRFSPSGWRPSYGWVLAAVAVVPFSPHLFAGDPPFRLMRETALVACAVAKTGSLLLFWWWVIRWLRGGAKARDPAILLFAGVAHATSLMLSLSWDLFDPMVLPGLPLLIGLGLERLSGSRPLAALRGAVAALSLWVILCSAAFKALIPFSWAAWQEPGTGAATVEPRLPALRGMRLSPRTAATLEGITEQITRHSRADEPVLVFPSMPVFYVLSGRRPPTFAYVHWFDVAPDFIVRADAGRLRDSQPAVIVTLAVPPLEWAAMEREFRNGTASGQRDMLQAIQALTRNYQLVSATTDPGLGNRISVWIRKP